MLIPHLVILDDFEQVKSIGRCLMKDWEQLLADCFPKIMVNILPYFALSGPDAQVAQQREKAYRVYDLLKDADCLGKQVNTAVYHVPTPASGVRLLISCRFEKFDHIMTKKMKNLNPVKREKTNKGA